MSLLTVYKASAGSGKTWRLTVEYIKILMKRPDAYKNTLAVTFTNKATAEMKARILNGLWEISRADVSAPSTGLLQTISRETDLSPTLIRDKARQALRLIIHDYSRFRVETIDSYFQSILRNLARELGLGNALTIELNDTGVLEEAVALVLDKSSEDPKLLSWITDYMEEAYSEGKSWKIDRKLTDLGKSIFKEVFKEKAPAIKDKLSNKQFIQTYKAELKRVQINAEKPLKQSASAFENLLKTNGLTVNDLSNGKSGVAGFFIKLGNGNFSDAISEGARVQEAMVNPEKWVTAKHPQRDFISQLAAEKLMPLLNETEALRQTLNPVITSCKLCTSHLSTVGLLSDISNEVNNLNVAANRFLLSNTNTLLNQLISDQDASFVFEKTGSEIYHILFDEFQDTSKLQWETFRPILNEGLANGNNSLLVGDEKQAIYRWRNGDWRILGSVSQHKNFHDVEEAVLGQNWRSDRQIIEFNNHFFSQAAGLLNQQLADKLEWPVSALNQAYKAIRQEVVREEQAGYVNIRFETDSDEQSYEEHTLSQLMKQTEWLQQAGIPASQIAILVRKNDQIQQIATWFNDHKQAALEAQGLSYDILSDDAFILASSKTLQILTNALRLIADPSNNLVKVQLSLDYQLEVCHRTGNLHDLLTEQSPFQLPPDFEQKLEQLIQRPLYELCETVFRLFDLSVIAGQDSYLYTFMDKVSEYLDHHPSDLASFLDYWDNTLYKVSVPAGTGLNGLRVLTIHKAKGLEFHTVLVPFCDWKLGGDVTDQLWCVPAQAPFSQMPLLPVDFKKEMLQSIFSDDYKEELIQRYLDYLNLLYVAFTRAKSNLIVFAKAPAAKDTKTRSDKSQKELETTSQKGVETVSQKGVETVSDLLWTILLPTNAGQDTQPGPNSTGQATQPGSNSDDQADEPATSMTQGVLNTMTATADQPKKQQLIPDGLDIPVSFVSFGGNIRFRQSNQSKAFSKGFDPEGFHTPYIDRGKLYHTLFSKLKTAADIEPAVADLLHEGLIRQTDVGDLIGYTQKALTQPDVIDWFSGEHTLFNECSILTHDHEGHTLLKRPDRVMLDKEGITVVDFKFGKPAAGYKKQVQQYMQLLQSMHYPTVNGYLWYVDEALVEPVQG